MIMKTLIIIKCLCWVVMATSKSVEEDCKKKFPGELKKNGYEACLKSNQRKYTWIPNYVDYSSEPFIMPYTGYMCENYDEVL